MRVGPNVSITVGPNQVVKSSVSSGPSIAINADSNKDSEKDG